MAQQREASPRQPRTSRLLPHPAGAHAGRCLAVCDVDAYCESHRWTSSSTSCLAAFSAAGSLGSGVRRSTAWAQPGHWMRVAGSSRTADVRTPAHCHGSSPPLVKMMRVAGGAVPAMLGRKPAADRRSVTEHTRRRKHRTRHACMSTPAPAAGWVLRTVAVACVHHVHIWSRRNPKQVVAQVQVVRQVDPG